MFAGLTDLVCARCSAGGKVSNALVCGGDDDAANELEPTARPKGDLIRFNRALVMT